MGGCRVGGNPGVEHTRFGPYTAADFIYRTEFDQTRGGQDNLSIPRDRSSTKTRAAAPGNHRQGIVRTKTDHFAKGLLVGWHGYGQWTTLGQVGGVSRVDQTGGWIRQKIAGPKQAVKVSQNPFGLASHFQTSSMV